MLEDEWNTEGRCWRMSGILRGGVGRCWEVLEDEWNTEGRCWRMSGILRGGVGGWKSHIG